MVEVIQHDGVTEWRFSSLASRLAGYTASAFLLRDGVLVDTGIPAASREFERLLSASKIRGVLLTHHHEDHAGNVEAVARRGLRIWMPEATLPLVTSVAPIRGYRRWTWASMTPLTSNVVPFEPETLEPIATPGHTDDHHAFWDARTRTLYSGDLFLGVAVRIAHHGEDPWVLIDSLERAAALNPVRMFDSHRGLVPDPVTALRAKAAWCRELIVSISAGLRRGESDRQILRAVMGGESITGLASGGEYSRLNFIRNVRGLAAHAGPSRAPRDTGA